MKIDILESMLLDVAELKPNEGQIPGLPANPRTISKDRLRKLKNSLKKNPDMMSLREILVFPYLGEYIVIGGNQRLQCLQSMDMQKVPCKLIPERATPEQLRNYLIKDNLEFGSWVDDMLASDWDLQDLVSMGLDEALSIELPEDEPESPSAPYTEDVPPPSQAPSSDSSLDPSPDAPPVHIPVTVPDNPVVEDAEVVPPSTSDDVSPVQQDIMDTEPLPFPQPAEKPVQEQPQEPVSEPAPAEQPQPKADPQANVTILTIGSLSIPLSTAERDTIIRKANTYQQQHSNCVGLLIELLGQ